MLLLSNKKIVGGIKMKRLLILPIIVVTLLVFIGCTEKETTPNVAVKDIMSSIETEVEQIAGLTELNFTNEEMSEFDQQTIETLGFNLEDIEEGIMKYPMINLQVDEVVIIKAKDEASIPAINEAIQTHIENQMAAFENYLPENYEMVKNHILKTKGNYVLLAISKDAEKIEEVFDNALQ